MRGSALFLIVFLMAAAVVDADLLVNDGFEEPAATTNWAGSSWSATGDCRRLFSGARSGKKGVRITTGTAGTSEMFQDAAVSPGTYTFSGWLKIEQGAVPTGMVLAIEWMDADTNVLQSAESDVAHFDTDGLWHRIHVTDNCTSSALDFVRTSLRVGYDAASGTPSGILFDDAELYSGGLSSFPYIVNGNFERGGTNDGAWFYGSEWSVVPESEANSRRTWWPNSGTYGAVLEGWQPGSHTSSFTQCLYPMSTGSWTFAIWLNQETLFQLSNAALRIEWFDETYTNKVQVDTVHMLTVTNDETWYRYEVQGSCGDTNVFEVRAVAEFTHGKDTNNSSMYLDDARFIPGGFTNTVIMDWGYHNHYHFDPTLEHVPGTNDYGPFLQINYAKTTTTFYAISKHPSIGSYPDSAGDVGVYVSYLPPHLPDLSNNWVTTYGAMERAGTAVIDSADPFHGMPVTGSVTVDVWRYAWDQPTSNGVPYNDRAITVYYAPIFRSVFGDIIEDEQYLVRLDGLYTNDYTEYAQIFHSNQWYKDYTYQSRPHVPVDTFTNSSFESEPSDTNWVSVGWQGLGAARRDDWSTHSGALGAFLPGWYTNSPEWRTFTESALVQPLVNTGGMYTFSAWMRSDNGVDLNALDIRLEWYDTNGVMVQADRKDLAGFPREGSWHHVHVTGTCLSNGLAYVVPKVMGQFWAFTGFPDRVQVDDADFYMGSYTGVHRLSNPGFEDGNTNEFRGSQWYTWPEYWGTYRPAWAPRRGLIAAQFDAKSTNASEYSQLIAQTMTPGTGTYTFAIWMICDTNFPLTNAELRLSWYDESLTNKVQADLVNTLSPPLDNYWHEYYVTSTCNIPDLYEVRASVIVGYLQQTNEGSTCRIDDGRFFEGQYVPNIIRDWSYHSGGAQDATAEGVPDSGAGPFLQVDYARTTSTFYVMANYPSIAAMPGETGMVYMRTSYFHPVSNEWVNIEMEPMTYAGTVTLTTGAPFHGLPTNTDTTVALYSYTWPHPMNDLGEPLTNSLWLYYSPNFRTYLDGEETDMIWLLDKGTETNDYLTEPQTFGSDYFSRDYGYNHQWTWDQDGDWIHDGWELVYFGAITNCDPNGNNDGDPRNNLDEYIADSIPTTNASYFPDLITAVSGRVSHIRLDMSTTNSRLYDLYWKTNLMDDDPWLPCNLNEPGPADGGDLWLIVTNHADVMYYRSGVKVVNPW